MDYKHVWKKNLNIYSFSLVLTIRKKSERQCLFWGNYKRGRTVVQAKIEMKIMIEISRNNANLRWQVVNWFEDDM